MAENSSAVSPQKAVPPPSTPNSNSNSNSNSNPQNPNPSTNLTSPKIPPSPSISDMSQISSPQISQSQSQINPSQTLDYPLKQQILSQQQQQQQQQNLLSSSSSSSSLSSNFQMQPGIQKTGSMPRLSQMQQQYGAAMAAGVMRQHSGMYGTQMSFGGAVQMQQKQASPQQQQQQLVAAAAGIARAGMNGQSGQLQTSAAHFGLQSQMMSQARSKGIVQGTQFHPANSGQALQGMQTMGVLGQLGFNPQLSANGLYAQQQRFAHGQIRPQQMSSQTALTSPQKLPGQSLPRTPSLAAMNQQLSSLPQNGQSSLVQTTLSQQQQWLKQMQPAMAAPVSPSYLQQQHQRQQQQALSQQLSSAQLQQRSMGLTQQQISQLIQQHPQLSTQQQQQHLIQQQQQQHLQQLQMLQQQQQLQSPRLPGPAQQKSLSLTGSQPETPASGTTMTGGSSSLGAEATNQLLGKRKIQDLVAQVDPLGKLDPEVEDLLLEIADDFIDSVTTFACSLAKHRKSSTIEAKDLLLHLEKNWHLTIPGFSREEQNYQKNPPHVDAHKKRMEMIRALMESQQSENSNGVKGVIKQIANDSAGDRPIKSSSSSEHLSMAAVGPQMAHKVHQF